MHVLMFVSLKLVPFPSIFTYFFELFLQFTNSQYIFILTIGEVSGNKIKIHHLGIIMPKLMGDF